MRCIIDVNPVENILNKTYVAIVSTYFSPICFNAVLFFFPFLQQVRKRHCIAKGVQLVDALEVYNQRKNGELIVHSEKSVKNLTFSPKLVSNVTCFPSWLLVEELFFFFDCKEIMHNM